MKKLLLTKLSQTLRVLFVLIFITSCSSDDDGNSSFGSIQSFNVTQESDKLIFNYSFSGSFDYFEITYRLPEGGSDNPDNGISFTVTDPNYSEKPLNELFSEIPGGTILAFNIRAVKGMDKSAWSETRTVVIDAYCSSPINADFNGSIRGTLSWELPSGADADYYEVQYGHQGFTLGTGETFIVEFPSTDEFTLEANTIYDFYVRAFCNNSLGWSEWTSAESGFVSNNQNICEDVTGLDWSIIDVLTNYNQVKFSWNIDVGNGSYKYTLVGNGESPNSGVINTITSWEAMGSYVTYLIPRNIYYGSSHDFYIKYLCQDGTETSWVKTDVDIAP